eukprot:TRINITY_DN3160_c0_g1_i1.p1 TRINITY_DN3160_c0_g1~~TRINITY_DN3160_c0_g1_i1.p1  ORF type:complete len:191 (+),score=6.04 TRINITY_DN3160_c0_g1_i1:617-1189(+)
MANMEEEKAQFNFGSNSDRSRTILKRRPAGEGDSPQLNNNDGDGGRRNSSSFTKHRCRPMRVTALLFSRNAARRERVERDRDSCVCVCACVWRGCDPPVRAFRRKEGRGRVGEGVATVVKPLGPRIHLLAITNHALETPQPQPNLNTKSFAIPPFTQTPLLPTPLPRARYFPEIPAPEIRCPPPPAIIPA